MPKKDKIKSTSCESAVSHVNDDTQDDEQSTSTTTDGSFLTVLRQDLQVSKGEIQGKLDLVISNQHSLLQRMNTLELRHTEVENSITFNDQSIQELKVENTELATKATKMAAKLEEAQAKINQLEDDQLRLERSSRSFNLRFGGVPELPHKSPAYPNEKIKEILSDNVALNLKLKMPIGLVDLQTHVIESPGTSSLNFSIDRNVKRFC